MKAIQVTKVSQLMSSDVKTCTAHDDLSRAAQLMWDNDCGFVPVIELTADGHRRVVGVVTDRDVCMATYTKGLPPSAIRVADVMSRAVRTCRSDDTPETAELLMRQHRIRRLLVVDAAEDLVGVLSLSDLARSATSGRKLSASSSTIESVGSTLAALSQRWYVLRSAASEPANEGAESQEPTQKKSGSPFDRRGFATVDAALARRQESDEQC